MVSPLLKVFLEGDSLPQTIAFRSPNPRESYEGLQCLPESAILCHKWYWCSVLAGRLLNIHTSLDPYSGKLR
jgi:hypothetical protein